MGELPLSVWFAAAAIATALPVLWWSVSSNRSNSDVRSRLATARATDLRELSLARPASERMVKPGFSTVGRLVRRFTPAGTIERLEQKIAAAGVGPTWQIERVLALKMILGGAGAVLGFTNWASEPGRFDLFALASALAAAGYLVPDVFLNSKGRARMDEIATQLPDVLDQITISVEAGLGFEAALAHVAQGTEGPLGEEFRRTLHDIRLGMSREQAFGLLLERVDVEELRHFVLALQQAERLGVPIADVLRTQSAELRVIRRQRAEENAQKLPVKMIFPLILCILPALVLVIMAPAVFSFFDNFPSGG